jgi:putative copper export protein
MKTIIIVEFRALLQINIYWWSIHSRDNDETFKKQWPRHKRFSWWGCLLLTFLIYYHYANQTQIPPTHHDILKRLLGGVLLFLSLQLLFLVVLVEC